jgi:hypothetical protein
MEGLRRASVVSAHALVIAGLACGISCGASNAPPGSTNMQPPSNPDACLHRGTTCVLDNDCCSLWCVNGVCTRRSP